MRADLRTTAPTDRNEAGNAESVILDAIRSLRYGSVEVIVHNARVVQVERKEKLRFAPRAEA